MSNKRSSRNTKKVLKALRQKRAKGGRSKKFVGGVEGINIDIPTEEEIKANIQAQQKSQETPQQKAARKAQEKAAKEEADRLAAAQKAEADRLKAERVAKQGEVTVSGGATSTNTPTTTTPSTGDPEPRRNQYPGNVGGQNAWRRAHNAWKARQGENARNIDVTESSGSGSSTDTTNSTTTSQGQGNNMTGKKTNLEEFVESIPRPEITPPNKPTINKSDVEILNVSSVGENASDADKLKAGISTEVQKLDTTPTAVAIDKAEAGVAQATPVTETDQAESVDDFDAAKYEAVKVEDLDPTEAAEGSVSQEAIADPEEIRELTQEAVAKTTTDKQKESTLAKDAQFTIDPRSFAGKVTGEEAQVSSTKAAEENQRKEITGEPAPDGDAAVINEVVGYEAKKEGLDSLYTEASLISYELFLKNEWKIIRKEKVTINNIFFERYKMTKIIKKIN